MFSEPPVEIPVSSEPPPAPSLLLERQREWLCQQGNDLPLHKDSTGKLPKKVSCQREKHHHAQIARQVSTHRVWPWSSAWCWLQVMWRQRNRTVDYLLTAFETRAQAVARPRRQVRRRLCKVPSGLDDLRQLGRYKERAEHRQKHRTHVRVWQTKFKILYLLRTNRFTAQSFSIFFSFVCSSISFWVLVLGLTPSISFNYFIKLPMGFWFWG